MILKSSRATPVLLWAASLVFAPGAGALQDSPGVAVPSEARTVSLDSPVPVSPAVRTGTFANGLTYFIREHQEPANRAEFRLVVNVGSLQEDEDQLGLAHFLEHMAFNGTRNFEKQELVRFMESIGMRMGPGLNASTSYDETVYMLTIPTDNPEFLVTGVQILRDWADGLTLDPEEIDRERGVVLEEWRFRRGVQARVREQQDSILFGESRYLERLPIGTVESLETFDHSALQRFYEEWYRPELMAVIAVGDFDAEEVEGLLRRHLAEIPPSSGGRERVVFELPSHQETLFSVVTDPEITASSVSVYQKMEPDEDRTIGGYRQQIVESLYNAILNERLAEIARKPDAPFLSATSGHGRLLRSSEVFYLGASVAEGGIEAGLESLFVEAARVDRFGFTESELERARINTLRMVEQIFINRETTTSAEFTEEYRRAFLQGESIPGIEYEWELYQRFVPEITLEEVNQVGREWIREGDRVVLLTAPESERPSLPGPDRLAGILRDVQTAELEPYEESEVGETLLSVLPEGAPVVEERELPREITEWRLANGVRVILRPTDFEEDQILLQGYSPGGVSLAESENLVAAGTAGQIIGGGGLGDHTAIALSRLLTGKVASASPVISEYEEGIVGGSSVRDLETMPQLIYMRFTEPRADDEFFQVWMTQTQAELANRDANPMVAFSDAIQEILTQDHPRRRPLTTERLSEADLARSLAFYEDRFSDAGDFTFVLVGSLDLDSVRPLVERYLGGLPSAGRVEAWTDHGVRPPRGIVEETVRKGLDPVSRTAIIFTGPFDYSSQQERLGYRALALALDQRLNLRVREELGGSYGVSVSPGANWRPEELFVFSIDFGSDPDRVDEILATIFEVTAEFREVGPTEAELSDAREAILRQFETDFDLNSTWLNQLVIDLQRGVDPAAALETFDGVARGLSVADLRDLAQRVLDPENYIRVTLLPE